MSQSRKRACRRSLGLLRETLLPLRRDVKHLARARPRRSLSSGRRDGKRVSGSQGYGPRSWLQPAELRPGRNAKRSRRLSGNSPSSSTGVAR